MANGDVHERFFFGVQACGYVYRYLVVCIYEYIRRVLNLIKSWNYILYIYETVYL